jgi:hypothetical protein
LSPLKAFKRDEVLSYILKFDDHDTGFVDQWKQCCTGSCGDRNTSLWTVCADPTKKVIFDSIHPTQAGWKAVVNLYATVSGYTALGPKLDEWKKKHHI